MSATGIERTQNLKADVVVIGSGGGLAAAVAAREKGASVILLEKENILGGYTRQANGLMACDSPVQKRFNISADTDEVFRKFMQWAHCRRLEPRVVRAYLKKTGDTIRWLEEKGVEFEVSTGHSSLGMRVQHMPKGMGAAVQKALIKDVEKLGITFFLYTSARRVMLGPERKVVGVVAEKDGEQFAIRTRSVIIATGGFGDNRELLKKYCPDYYDGMPVDVWPHHEAHSGDGLIMAEEIGAAIADAVPNYHMGPYFPDYLYPWQGLAALAMHRRTIWLNKNGRRFTDEAGSLGTGVGGNAILLQPDRIMFTVFDDVIRQKVEEGAEGFAASVARHAKEGGGEMTSQAAFPGLGDQLKKEQAKGGVKIADTWEEIAEWIGAKPDVLKAEIAEFNGFCEQGHDDVFTKDREFLFPLQQPPYYAMKCYVRVGETLGGIKVTERMEILDNAGNVIPGAYAAGVIADGFEPEDYNREIAGCAMGFAVNSGRIAGENAADYTAGK